MGVRRQGRFVAGRRSSHILEGEILHIGAHPHGYSNLQHIVVGLTVTQAAEYAELGWDVRLSQKETTFLGRTQTEDIFYIVLDIPKDFRIDDEISSWRINSYAEDTTQAVLEFTARELIFAYYDARPEKVTWQLTLTEIKLADHEDEIQEGSMLDRIRRGEIRGVIEISEGDYRELIARDIANAETIGDLRKIQNRERQWENRRNDKRTHWNVGETVVIGSKEYLVGQITEQPHHLVIRLDRKRELSITITVPR